MYSLTEDLDFTWRLRNENRKYFFHNKIISRTKHWEWFMEMQEDKKLWFYIIWLGKIRIGTISYKEKEIGNIIIDKKYRRKGYLRKAISLLLKKHKGEAFLKVLPNNMGAIKAYKALGFREKETILWK